MKTFLLAGGSDRRPHRAVRDVPTAMASVAGKPFLEWQLMLLKVQGFVDIVLCVAHPADTIIDYFGDGTRLGVNIEYSVEREPLGTAGAIRNASRFIDGTFLLQNGETFLDVDYRGLVEFHEAKEAMLTLSLLMAEDAGGYSSVAIDINNRIVGFREKQADAHPFGYISAGVYVAEPSILDFIDANAPVSFEHDIIPALVGKGTVYGYITDGLFIDIGLPASYEAAQDIFARFA